MENIALVDWSRAQFALTAMYHWLFVPLTLGLGFILAIMETLYVKTGDEKWKTTVKFWMRLFGINFAIGVATGLILEFEFGTNWSNYSWFVGDIFGAPLAIEGIFAFFMESTFIAVMFFGWGKVSKRFHLISTWLVAVGASLSALWILVANAWMQNPVGMTFNPETARNEMVDFWAILLSPTAMNKFFHTVTSGFVLGAVFVIGVSAWFLLKKRDQEFALRSIKIAGIFGLISILLVAFTGDGSAEQVTKNQPMKLAAMEGLYQGKEGAPLILAGIANPSKTINDGKEPMLWKMEIPKLLSLLGHRRADAFVAGIEDLVNGNPEQGILSFNEKKARGTLAVNVLKTYREAKQKRDTQSCAFIGQYFDRTTEKGAAFYNDYFQYFGYSYIRQPQDLVPNVLLTFYSFHAMVALGGYFILFFAVILFFVYRKDLEKTKWLLWLSLLSIPLVYLCSMLGWVVAEVGRQPWVIQNLMPTSVAVSHVSVQSVQVTFWLFATLFTAMLIAEISILLKQIKKGPNSIEN